MFLLRLTCILTAIAWLNLFPLVARADDDEAAARAAAAERYLAAVPMQRMLDDMVTELSTQVAPEQREAFATDMRKLLKADRLEQIAREASVAIFSAAELNALADFYSTAAGQGVLRKFGAYMGRIMPAIQQEIRDALQQIRQ